MIEMRCQQCDHLFRSPEPDCVCPNCWSGNLEIIDQQPRACQHHFHIESPCGPNSWGTCTLCGESALFNNSIAYDREECAQPRPIVPGAPYFPHWPALRELEELPS